MKRKILSVLLIGIIVVGLTGCGKNTISKKVVGTWQRVEGNGFISIELYDGGTGKIYRIDGSYDNITWEIKDDVLNIVNYQTTIGYKLSKNNNQLISVDGTTKYERRKEGETKEIITCTKSDDFVGSYEVDKKIEYVFIDNYVTEREIQEDIECFFEDEAEALAQMYEGQDGFKVKRDGTKVNVTYKEEIDKDSQKNESNYRSNVLSEMKQDGFTCKYN